MTRIEVTCRRARWAAGIAVLTAVVRGIGPVANAAAAPPPEMVLQLGHRYPIHALAIAARGDRLASSSGDGALLLWNPRTGELLRTLTLSGSEEGRARHAKPLALSRDGVILVYAPAQGPIQLWDTRSATLLKTLPGSAEAAYALRWGPEDRMLAVSTEAEARVWAMPSGTLVRTLPSGGDLAFSADGKQLATARWKQAILWDLETGRRLREFQDEAGVDGPVALSPDGRLVATGGEDPSWKPPVRGPDEPAPSEAFYAHLMRVKLWDARTGRRLRLWPGHGYLDGGTETLVFTPDGRGLVSGGPGSVDVWNVATGQRRYQLSRTERSGSVSSPIAVASGGNLLATAGGSLRGSYASLWRLQRGEWLRSLPTAAPAVHGLAFSPDSRSLASGEEQLDANAVRLWDMEQGRLTQTLAAPGGNLRDLFFLPDGTRVAANYLNAAIAWDARTGRRMREWQGPVEETQPIIERASVLLSPDGQTLISRAWGGGRPLKIWDAESNQLRRTIEGVEGDLRETAFTPDSRWIASFSRFQERALTVWSLETGQVQRVFSGMGDVYWPILFSVDGRSVALSVLYRRVLLRWEVIPSRLQGTATVSDPPINGLAFSPDGRTLAIGGRRRVALLDARTDQEVQRLEGHADGVYGLAFSADGRRLASGSDDGTIRLWDLGAGRLLLSFITFPPERDGAITPDWIAHTPDGYYDASPGADRFLRWRVGDRLYPAAAYGRLFHRPDRVRQALAGS